MPIIKNVHLISIQSCALSFLAYILAYFLHFRENLAWLCSHRDKILNQHFSDAKSFQTQI